MTRLKTEASEETTNTVDLKGTAYDAVAVTIIIS
jgi:hypothetical protein